VLQQIQKKDLLARKQQVIQKLLIIKLTQVMGQRSVIKTIVMTNNEKIIIIDVNLQKRNENGNHIPR